MNRYAHDLATFPGDAALAWRLSGPGGVWEEIADRSVYRLFRRGHLVIVEQDLAGVEEPPPPEDVLIRQVDDPAALEPITGRRKAVAFGRYLSQGLAGFAAWRGKEPLGYTWLARSIVPGLVTIPLDLPAEACYGFALFVVPEARRGGLGSALVGRRLRQGREWGCRTAWRAIVTTNAPALGTLAKTSGDGTRLVGEYRYLKLGRRFFSRFTPYPPAPEKGAGRHGPPGEAGEA